MSAPKYCSWDVKELASDYGWTELPTHPNDEDRMLSFYSDQHGGVRANVYIKTGTVATSLDHPTKGKTQLYRGQRDTFEKLEKIFDDPRVHTDSGYRTRAKLREEGEAVVPVDVYEGLDDIEQLRSEGDEASDYADKDVMADLYSQGRFEEDGEFDGESLMEKLMSKWDEEEEIDSDEIVLSEFKDTLNLLDDGYHRSISEVDYSDITSTSEESEGDDLNENDTEDETTNGSEDGHDDSDQHETEESDESEGNESDEDCSESDGIVTESGNESNGFSDQASDDYSNDSDDYSF